jgi:hypothetical protein
VQGVSAAVSAPDMLEDLIVIYDIRDAAGWETANRRRNYWGKTHTHVHYLDYDHVALVFRPAPDESWRSWELVRLSWILDEDLEGRAA